MAIIDAADVRLEYIAYLEGELLEDKLIDEDILFLYEW
jgi:hypothetical protein